MIIENSTTSWSRMYIIVRGQQLCIYRSILVAVISTIAFAGSITSFILILFLGSVRYAVFLRNSVFGAYRTLFFSGKKYNQCICQLQQQVYRSKPQSENSVFCKNTHDSGLQNKNKYSSLYEYITLLSTVLHTTNYIGVLEKRPIGKKRCPIGDR